jgi:small basic protein (TIGR04137 family)
MTMDKSLRIRRGSVRTVNVLSRDERLQRLKATERWKDGDSPFGLPKVRVFRLTIKKKKKKKEEEAAEGAAATGVAAPADAGKKADASKKPEAGKKGDAGKKSDSKK